MATATVLPTLDSTARDAQRFTNSAPCYSSIMPPLCLPDPPSLYPSLIAAGAEEKVAKEMNRAYNTRASELRAYYEESISNTFALLTGHRFLRDSEKRILATFASLYLTKVKSWIEDGVAAYKNSRKQAKQAACRDKVSQSTNPRRTFNTNCIPLLERFFNENQFPTQADKIFLAKKSGMTYRQIHVWFQNRRNRKKRLNETWRKDPPCEATTPPFDTLNACMETAIPNEQTSRAPLKVFRSNESQSMQENCSPETALHRKNPSADKNNALDACTAPLHAFPSPYLPVCSHEQFSLQTRGQMFSVPRWERCPDHNISSRPPEIDINDLVNRFTLLSVRDIYSKPPATQDSLTATAITVIPPPAPHPALIRSTKTMSSLTHLSPFPIVRALQPVSQAFTELTELSMHASFISNCAVPCEKVSSLPRQYPASLSPRHVTPTPSGTSSSGSSPCASLRSLSDSSDLDGHDPGPMVH